MFEGYKKPKRPNPFKLVGGTEYVPPPPEELLPENPEEAEVDEDDLLDLWADIEFPDDYQSATDIELLRKDAEIVKGWSIGQLFFYLNNSKKWQRHTGTRAVYEEVERRVNRGDIDHRS